MLSFHNNPAIKKQYLARLQAHYQADEIVHGKYWENGKGCAVGCTVHSNKHSAYESKLGIPVMLARLEDRIFEGLPNGEAKKFPGQFLQAIRPGVDLSLVGWKFLHWLMEVELAGNKNDRIDTVIKRCANMLVPLTKGQPVDEDECRAVRDDADAASAVFATASADAAARAAAFAARAAAFAASAAFVAADASADAAAFVAAAARAAAFADAAAAFAASAAAADAQCHSRMSKKLLTLLRQAKHKDAKIASVS
jgi:hypothetical protein